MSLVPLKRILLDNRHALTAGLAVLVAVALWSSTRSKVYEAFAACQLEHRDPFVLSGSAGYEAPPGLDAPSLARAVEFAQSEELLQRVAAKIDDELSTRIVSRHRSKEGHVSKTLPEVLAENHAAKPFRHSMVILVTHRNPDPALAARLANLFMHEIVLWSTSPEASVGTIRRLEDAQPPTPGDYVSPDHVRDLSLGLAGALAAIAVTRLLRRPRSASG